MPTREDTLTTRKAAELMGVSVRTVQLWVESGVLRAWKTPGGHRRVARDSVVELMQIPETSSQKDSSANTCTAPGKPLTVLVVEDDDNLRRLYELTINNWQLPVDLHVCENGFAGLVEIGRLQPDLVITDLDMPNMDGFAMLRSLIKRPVEETGELLVVTGLTDEEITARGGIPDGITMHKKPVPFSDIRLRIENKLATINAA